MILTSSVLGFCFGTIQTLFLLRFFFIIAEIDFYHPLNRFIFRFFAPLRVLFLRNEDREKMTLLLLVVFLSFIKIFFKIIINKSLHFSSVLLIGLLDFFHILIRVALYIIVADIIFRLFSFIQPSQFGYAFSKIANVVSRPFLFLLSPKLSHLSPLVAFISFLLIATILGQVIETLI